MSNAVPVRIEITATNSAGAVFQQAAGSLDNLAQSAEALNRALSTSQTNLDAFGRSITDMGALAKSGAASLDSLQQGILAIGQATQGAVAGVRELSSGFDALAQATQALAGTQGALPARFADVASGALAAEAAIRSLYQAQQQLAALPAPRPSSGVSGSAASMSGSIGALEASLQDPVAAARQNLQYQTAMASAQRASSRAQGVLDNLNAPQVVPVESQRTVVDPVSGESRGGGFSESSIGQFIKYGIGYQLGYSALGAVGSSLSRNQQLSQLQGQTAAGTGYTVQQLQPQFSNIADIAGSGTQPYNQTQLTQGFYGNLSTPLYGGATTAEAINQLGVEYSQAFGAPDTASANNAILTYLSGYGLNKSPNVVPQATAFANQLVASTVKGRLSGDQYAQILPQIGLATAKNLGISGSDLLAMTAQESFSLAPTEIANDTNSLIASLVKPTEQQRGQAKALGIDLSPGSLQRYGGIQGLVDLLGQREASYTPEQTASVNTTLFGTQAAGRAAAALTAGGPQELSDVFSYVGGAQGRNALGTAVKTENSTPGAQLANSEAALQKQFDDMTKDLMPIEGNLIGGMKDLVTAVDDLVKAFNTGNLSKYVGGAGDTLKHLLDPTDPGFLNIGKARTEAGADTNPKPAIPGHPAQQPTISPLARISGDVGSALDTALPSGSPVSGSNLIGGATGLSILGAGPLAWVPAGIAAGGAYLNNALGNPVGHALGQVGNAAADIRNAAGAVGNGIGGALGAFGYDINSAYDSATGNAANLFGMLPRVGGLASVNRSLTATPDAPTIVPVELNTGRGGRGESAARNYYTYEGGSELSTGRGGRGEADALRSRLTVEGTNVEAGAAPWDSLFAAQHTAVMSAVGGGLTAGIGAENAAYAAAGLAFNQSSGKGAKKDVNEAMAALTLAVDQDNTGAINTALQGVIDAYNQSDLPVNQKKLGIYQAQQLATTGLQSQEAKKAAKAQQDAQKKISDLQGKLNLDLQQGNLGGAASAAGSLNQAYASLASPLGLDSTGVALAQGNVASTVKAAQTAAAQKVAGTAENAAANAVTLAQLGGNPQDILNAQRGQLNTQLQYAKTDNLSASDIAVLKATFSKESFQPMLDAAQQNVSAAQSNMAYVAALGGTVAQQDQSFKTYIAAQKQYIEDQQKAGVLTPAQAKVAMQGLATDQLNQGHADLTNAANYALTTAQLQAQRVSLQGGTQAQQDAAFANQISKERAVNALLPADQRGNANLRTGNEVLQHNQDTAVAAAQLQVTAAQNNMEYVKNLGGTIDQQKTAQQAYLASQQALIDAQHLSGQSLINATQGLALQAQAFAQQNYQAQASQLSSRTQTLLNAGDIAGAMGSMTDAANFQLANDPSLKNNPYARKQLQQDTAYSRAQLGEQPISQALALAQATNNYGAVQQYYGQENRYDIGHAGALRLNPQQLALQLAQNNQASFQAGLAPIDQALQLAQFGNNPTDIQHQLGVENRYLLGGNSGLTPAQLQLRLAQNNRTSYQAGLQPLQEAYSAALNKGDVQGLQKAITNLETYQQKGASASGESKTALGQDFYNYGKQLEDLKSQNDQKALAQQQQAAQLQVSAAQQQYQNVALMGGSVQDQQKALDNYIKALDDAAKLLPKNQQGTALAAAAATKYQGEQSILQAGLTPLQQQLQYDQMMGNTGATATDYQAILAYMQAHPTEPGQAGYTGMDIKMAAGQGAQFNKSTAASAAAGSLSDAQKQLQLDQLTGASTGTISADEQTILTDMQNNGASKLDISIASAQFKQQKSPQQAYLLPSPQNLYNAPQSLGNALAGFGGAVSALANPSAGVNSSAATIRLLQQQLSATQEQLLVAREMLDALEGGNNEQQKQTKLLANPPGAAGFTPPASPSKTMARSLSAATGH